MNSVLLAVISALGGILGGGGLTALFLLPQTRKKEDLNNNSLAISHLESALKDARAEIGRKEADLDKKDKLIENVSQGRESLRQKYEDMCEECASAKLMMCVHLGCVLRDPSLGQGDNYLKAHADEPSLGADYVPVNQLLQRLGRKRKSEEE